MSNRWYLPLGAVWSCLLLAAWGCTSAKNEVADKPEPAAADPTAEFAADSATAGPASTEKKPDEKKPDEKNDKKPAEESSELADLQPYDAPPLAEIDKKAEWIDQPVLDFMKLLREQQAKEKPLVSVTEALKLRNDSKEANEKILSALGRLPPADTDADWDATINRHSGGEVRSTNPLMISSTAEFDVNDLIGFGLFGFDWNMQAAASSDSVTSWQTSKDHLLDKVVLRDDLTWSDGKPITAHDVAFSFRTILNPKVPVPALRSGTNKLRWVEAYDDRTIVFFHKEALATNQENISFSIIPQHVYEKSVVEDPTLANSEYHIALQKKPIVGGAYEITSRVQGQETVLTRRESYYMHAGKQVRDKPYFKTIRFRFMSDTNTALLAIKKGDIDEMILTPSQWTTQTIGDDFYDRNTKATGLEWVYFYFGWNLKTPFFSDLRVRQAMSYAFNYDELLNTLCYGLYGPCNGIFHPGAWMAPKKPLPYYQQDLSKAESLLDAAGWTDHDGDGFRDKKIDGKLLKFEFTVLSTNIPDRVKICELLRQNLEQIGVVCNILPLESAVLQERLQKHEFEATFSGWGTGTDPDTSDNIWKTGEGRNFVGYSNPEVDKLYAEGRREFDREKRGVIYARIDELIYADQPYTFLYFRNSFYGFNKQLRGYKFSPRGPFSYSPGFGSIWKIVP